MERQGMGYNERRAGLDSPEGASAPPPDKANRGETAAGGASEPVEQPWWDGGLRDDEAADDKPHAAGNAQQATPAEPPKHRPGGYMYRGVMYGDVASERRPGATAPAGTDEPPDEVVLAVMSEEPAGGPAVEEGAHAEPAMDSPPWWQEGSRLGDAAGQGLGAGDDEEERPGPAVSMPASYGGLASEPGPAAAVADEPPDEAVVAVMPEEPAGGPAVEEETQGEPAMDSPPWWQEGSRLGDAAGQGLGAGDDEEERPGPAVSMPASYGGLASEPGPAAAVADEPPDEVVVAVVPEEPAGGPAVEEETQGEPAMDSPPWWPEGSRPGDAAGQGFGAGDDEEERLEPAVSMPAGYGGLASEPGPGVMAAAGADEPSDEAAVAVVPEEPAGTPAVEEETQAEPATDSPRWWPEGSRPGDTAGQGLGAGDDEEKREVRDRVHSASPAGLPRAAEGPADVPPADLIRSIVAEVCPDELLLVDTTEAPMPEWAHAAVTAARNDMARRLAERRAVDTGEYLQLAIVEHIMGLHEDADGHLKEALPQSDRFGPVLNALAVTNLARGKIAPAIVYCKEALRETDGDDAVRAAASSNLGDLYRLQGNASQAAEAYEAAISCLGSQGEAHGLPRLHFRAGCLYRHLGEADKARAHLSESVRLFKESGDETGHIHALGTLGLALNDSGLHDLALRSFEEGVRICLRTGDKPGAALVQDGMGLVYMSQGQLTRALAYLESALSLHRELGDREGEAATRNNIEKIHHSRGEPETRPQESGDRGGAPSRSLEAEEILRRAGSAELEEKHEAVDPNARAGSARVG